MCSFPLSLALFSCICFFPLRLCTVFFPFRLCTSLFPFRLCTYLFPLISCFPFPGVVTLGLIRSYTSAPLYRSRCTDIEYMNGIFKLFFFSFFRTGYWIIVFQNANRRRRGLCDQCQNFNISTDPKSYFIFRILWEDGASLASVNRYPRGRNMTLAYAGHKDEYRKTTRNLASRRFWSLCMRTPRVISLDRLWTFQFKKFPPKKVLFHSVIPLRTSGRDGQYDSKKKT